MVKHKTGYYLFMAVFLLLTVGPFLWAFLIAVTPEYDMFTKNTGFLPEHITWENFLLVLSPATKQGRMFHIGMKNSIKAVAMTMLTGLPSAILSAYALARMKFKGRIFIKNALLFTMAIPVMATIIPIYRIFSTRQILDHMFWLTLVYTSSLLPVLTWLISNYFATIPKELEEAALTDGCGTVHAFIKIILPASMPAILSAALILFLSTWSQFQIPLILASSELTKPVSIVTSEFMTKDAVQYGITAAAGLCAVIPPALLTLICSKYIVAGITNGAVKE